MAQYRSAGVSYQMRFWEKLPEVKFSVVQARSPSLKHRSSTSKVTRAIGSANRASLRRP
ncbi:hypothetical protein [Streptomyces acidicola]|uniref:hypothetical protein n=1 Tax=Streptomyces acidicola TaxID=2596892 RepID=UPI0038231682